MHKLLLTVILMFIAYIAFSQQKNDKNSWHLTIVDGVTTKGIDKVTVTINRAKYFNTDTNGVIELDKTFISHKDSINISCIGYRSVILTPGVNNKYPDTVRLLVSVKYLDEVKIGSSEPKGISIGNIKKSYNTHRVPNPDEEYAQFIPNDKKIKGTINSIQYVLNDELQGIEMPFRVGLYTKNTNSIFPDKELIKDTIIVSNPKKKRWVSVDISKYNIELPENGVIATFETLSASNYKDSIWYDKKPQGNRWIAKMPGIDMDLKKKDNYTIDREKQNRNGPYSMVINVNDKWSYEEVRFHSYIFTDGINLAITLTISPN